MTDEPEGTLLDLLVRLEFILAEPVDFTRTDTATTLVKVRVLTAAAIYFNLLSVADFGVERAVFEGRVSSSKPWRPRSRHSKAPTPILTPSTRQPYSYEGSP